MENSTKKIRTGPGVILFEKAFPHINPGASGTVSINRNDFLDFTDLEYGRYLHRLFLKEWELCQIMDQLQKFEDEHADSLALLMENESQKMLLEELNDRLNTLFEIHAKDMKMAASVQRTLLFESPPVNNSYDIAFTYRPCSSVSGDFYDFYLNSETDELKGIVLADVSGHGIASSLLTILAKPIFFREFNSNKDIPLHNVLDKINSRLIAQMSASENYLTAVLLRFNGNVVEYTNSAHPDIILRREADDSVEIVSDDNGATQGGLLGIAAVAQPFSSCSFEMHQGDSLVVYTDCFIESQNIDGDEFGENGIASSLTGTGGMDSAAILKKLITDFNKFTAGRPLKDDLSVIVLKKK